MRKRTRAVSDEAKEGRRGALLNAASRLFGAREYEDVAIDEIAKAAGLAKGTFYLYFDTKETAFLELVESEVAAWGAALSERLAGRRWKIRETAREIVRSVVARPSLVRLLGLMHAILERNVAPEFLLDFKHRLLETMTRVGAAIEQATGLEPGSGVRIVFWLDALVVGLGHLTSDSPALEKMLARDEALRVLRPDFGSELETVLYLLLSGLA